MDLVRELVDCEIGPVGGDVESLFAPVEGLRRGDVLFQHSWADYRYPGKGKGCVVHRVFDPPRLVQRGIAYYECDFSLLVMIDGCVVETLFDSRYFDRAGEYAEPEADGGNRNQ
jgi:hypothetical protein